MNIALTLAYFEPQLRRLDVVVDGKPWYQDIMNVVSGLATNLQIGEHSLSIHIDPQPDKTSKE